MGKVDLTQPSEFIPCQKKVYDIYVCKPPEDTVVINKLEQATVLKNLGDRGKTYYTVEELRTMQATNPDKFNYIAQCLQQGIAYRVCAEQPYVLAGTMGEMWTISAEKLAQKYTFIRDAQQLSITPQSIQERCIKGTALMNWTLVRSRPDNSKAFAKFMPKSMVGQIQTSWVVLTYNDPNAEHGYGDFIIAQDKNGTDAYVVNGLAFARTYNNKGFTDYLDTKGADGKSVNIADLPKLFNYEKHNGLSVYRQVARAALMKWYNMPAEAAEKEATDLTVEQLEAKVDAINSIAVGVNALFGRHIHDKLDSVRESSVKKLGNVGGTEFLAQVLKNDNNELESLLDIIKGIKISEKDIIFALERIHRTWVKNNTKKLEREKTRYQFLTLDYIGWDEASSDLLFIKPVLKYVGVDISMKEIEKQYWVYVDEHIRLNKLGNLIIMLSDLEDLNKLMDKFSCYPNDSTIQLMVASMCYGGDIADAWISNYGVENFVMTVRNSPSVRKYLGVGHYKDNISDIGIGLFANDYFSQLFALLNLNGISVTQLDSNYEVMKHDHAAYFKDIYTSNKTYFVNITGDKDDSLRLGFKISTNDEKTKEYAKIKGKSSKNILEYSCKIVDWSEKKVENDTRHIKAAARTMIKICQVLEIHPFRFLTARSFANSTAISTSIAFKQATGKEFTFKLNKYERSDNQLESKFQLVDEKNKISRICAIRLKNISNWRDGFFNNFTMDYRIGKDAFKTMDGHELLMFISQQEFFNIKIEEIDLEACVMAYIVDSFTKQLQPSADYTPTNLSLQEVKQELQRFDDMENEYNKDYTPTNLSTDELEQELQEFNDI